MKILNKKETEKNKKERKLNGNKSQNFEETKIK